ncbi:NLR family CARD domain-containing protein 3 [Phytophthora citrophthora]|uniref:NLR family CARD domain-containing protein 3 n=1 Tax=Phytophthora citrophthora TaxID=4793 RepID=A0AAD9LFS9_9STRA|nr:NLR family CARD domain-containing protein 3 [Phytophthora citrophthora]
MEVKAKVKVRGVAGCELLRHIESVDPRAAEGLRREKPLDSTADVDFLLEEETRRSITDPYQKLLFEVKVLHRKGNFKSSQGAVIVQRVRDIAAGGKTELDLSGFLISNEFVDLLVPYLRSKTCKLAALNLAGTSIGVEAAVSITKATNGALQKLQFSDNPIPAGILRVQAAESGQVILSGRNFNHLDAAAIGILVERERKHLQKLDLSGSLLTGPKSNVFQGITILFECLKKCRHLQELNLGNANLRSDGLVAFANAIQDFPALEKLDLSQNRLVHNSTNEKRLSGIDSLCNALWRVKTLRELSLAGNYLDYESSACIAEMLKVNCTIVTLTLCYNPLGDAGAVDVSSALKKNVTLLTLHLSNCQISCEGVTEVTTVLRKFNSTLRTLKYAYSISNNPDVRSQGCRSLVKCASVNHKITEVVMNPGARYEKYVTKMKDFLAVNELLNTVQTTPKRFTGFPLLSETQRTNFVGKLERFSDGELLQLHEARIIENAVTFSDEKEAAGLSTLRHYAAVEQYAPLKRLLWCFEVGNRQKSLIERSSSKKEANNDEDDEDIWDYPLV